MTDKQKLQKYAKKNVYLRKTHTQREQKNNMQKRSKIADFNNLFGAPRVFSGAK